MRKSVKVSLFLLPLLTSTSTHYARSRDISHQCTEAEVHLRISRQYPIRLHQLDQSARMRWISAVRRGSRVSFLSIAWKIWRGSRKRSRKKNAREGKRIKTDKTAICTTTRRPEHREVETGSRQRYTLSISLSLSLSLSLARKSIFVTADWARLDSRG